MKREKFLLVTSIIITYNQCHKLTWKTRINCNSGFSFITKCQFSAIPLIPVGWVGGTGDPSGQTGAAGRSLSLLYPQTQSPHPRGPEAHHRGRPARLALLLRAQSGLHQLEAGAHGSDGRCRVQQRPSRNPCQRGPHPRKPPHTFWVLHLPDQSAAALIPEVRLRARALWAAGVCVPQQIHAELQHSLP